MQKLRSEEKLDLSLEQVRLSWLTLAEGRTQRGGRWNAEEVFLWW